MRGSRDAIRTQSSLLVERSRLCDTLTGMRVKNFLAPLLACLGASLVIGCQDGEMSLEQRLTHASANGDIDAVKDLLDQGAMADGGVDWKGSPLMFALYEGNLAIADILVDNGADVNVRFGDAQSLLDMIINMKNEADDEVEEAKYELAIDWLYENGARRRP